MPANPIGLSRGTLFRGDLGIMAAGYRFVAEHIGGNDARA